MIVFRKTIRYYYWLISSFLRKNIVFLLLSFISAFLLIILSINFFPYIDSFLFKKTEKIGMVGKYNLQNSPPQITSLISNPLLTVDEKGEIIPILIKSYEILDNDKTYRFHLKPNLRWNDGKKFSAYDINYSFKGIATRIIDENTVEFRLNQPLSILPVYLSKPIIRNPFIGVVGLYQVKNYVIKKGDLVAITLTPNKQGLPYKTYKIFDTENKLINAYKKGEINLIMTSKKNIADLFSSWKNTKIIKSTDYNQILTLFFNNDIDILSSKEIRKTLAYATPEFKTLGETASGPIPPLSWSYFSDLKKYPHNLEKAVTLLKKNLSSSKSKELNLYTFYDYIAVGEQIKRNFEKIGLKINLRVLSYIPQQFDMLLTVWNPPLDPDQYYFWHSTQKEGNITNYKNVKIDKLLEDGRKTINLEERKKIYAEFQKNIMEDLPAHFIYHPFVYMIERK